MRRKLSSMERYMLFFGRQFPLNFGFFVSVAEQLRDSVISKALADLKARHALPYCHQEYTDGKNADLVFSDRPALLCSKITSNQDWEEVMKSLIVRPFDPLVGPLFSLDYRYVDQGTEMFFVFQHGAADGIGAVYFIHDFLKLCGGMDVSFPQQPQMPNLYEIMKPEIYNELLTRPEPAWKKETPPPPKPFDMPKYKAPDFTLLSWKLDATKTANLAQKAKSFSQTVNSYLGALVLKASADIFGPQEGTQRTIQCPVDFRNYLKEEFREIAGVYNGIVKVKVDCTNDLLSCAQDIRAGIMANRDNLKDIEEYFHFRDSFDNIEDPESLLMGFPPDLLDYDFSFSNLGRTLILNEYGSLKVGEFFGPVFTAVNNETVIGLNTTNGCLRMTMIFDSKIPKAEEYGLLAKKIDRIIADL